MSYSFEICIGDVKLSGSGNYAFLNIVLNVEQYENNLKAQLRGSTSKTDLIPLIN
uniref:Uncharacterized protein n=1 Tax=Magallana gigas TaxID=29159 RepID=K1QCL0_MAGGI